MITRYAPEALKRLSSTPSLAPLSRLALISRSQSSSITPLRPTLSWRSLCTNPPTVSAVAAPDKYAVLFDLDHTLINAVPFYQHAANLTIAALNRTLPPNQHIAPLTKQELAQCHSTQEMFARRFNNQERKEEAIALYYKSYSDLKLPGASIFLAHTRSMLEQLQQNNTPLLLVSNSEKCMVRSMLETTGIRQYFTAVVGAHPDIYEQKPNPAPMIAAFDKAKISNSTIICIGDSLTDVSAARNAAQLAATRHNLRLVTALYNYHGLPAEKIHSTAPDYVLPDSQAMIEFTSNLSKPGGTELNKKYLATPASLTTLQSASTPTR
jgi:phosphoglycolate phosphatase